MAKKKAEAHHGGAWKVAYADFVTAMMALFMVLWICSQDKKILIATSKYFKQPFNAVKENAIGIMDKNEGGTKGKDRDIDTTTATNLAFMNALASELNRMINMNETDNEKPIDMEVTSDGLKITLYDRPKHAIFQKGSAEITEWGGFVMQNLAWIIERNSLKLHIDGHAATGSVPTAASANYGLWELTADRSNAARRLLVKYAVNPKEIERVTGYADTKPLPNLPRESASNERITVSLAVNR